MPKFVFQGVKTIQSDSGSEIILFSARATEILEWAGVPQRRLLADEETVGWQRPANTKRVDSIAKFLENPKNLIINPLLCAAQNLEMVTVEGIDGDGSGVLITIEVDTYSDLAIDDRIVADLIVACDAVDRALKANAP